MIQSVVNYGMKDSVKYFFIFFSLHAMNKLRKKKYSEYTRFVQSKEKKRGSHNICLPVHNRMLDSSMSTKMQNKNYPPK